MYRITHSLLSAWDYATGDRAGDDSLAEFVKTLKREPKQRTQSMQAGIDFEDEVTFYAANGYLKYDDAPKMQVVTAMGDTIIQDVHTYSDAERKAIIRFGEKVRWAAPQVRAEKEMKINGIDFLLVGVADYLKAGIIYDTKRIGMYEYGRYVSNTQHPMYFELFPEAVRFDYLIFDGYQTHVETFRRTDCEPIQNHISRFVRDLRDVGLLETYKEYWEEK